MTCAGDSDNGSQGNPDAAAVPEPTIASTSTASSTPATPAAGSEGVRFVDANSMPATPIRPVGRKRSGGDILASIADFLTKKHQRTEAASTLSTSSRVFGVYVATELDEIRCPIARRRARSAIQYILFQANMAQDIG